MRFTKDIEYALIGLIALAGSPGLHSARDLAEEYQIPFGLLSKILQKLGAEGIVVSVQGAHGGYRINRPIGEITLGEIIDSVHGTRHVAPCLDDEGCNQVAVCNIKPSIEGVQSMWDELINSMTLLQFAQSRANAKPVQIEVGS